jgi:hypothetical protein
MHAGQFAEQRCEARAVAGGVLAWDIGLEPLATAYTAGLVSQEVRNLPLERWTLDDLLCGVRRAGSQLAMSTGAGGWRHVLHLGGASKRVPDPGCPFLAPQLPDDGRRLGFVKGESDDGGVREVLEVCSSRPCY